MTDRFWINGPDGNTPVSAERMNGIEADLDARVKKTDAVVNLSIGTVTTGTAAASVTGIAPDQKLNLVLPATSDSTVASYLNTGGTSSNAALLAGVAAAVSGTTRTNYATTPGFNSGIGTLSKAAGGATNTLSWQSGPGADGKPGFARLTYTTAATSNQSGLNGNSSSSPTTTFASIPVATATDVYTVSAWVRSSSARTVSWGGYYRQGTTAVTSASSSSFDLQANVWTRVSKTLSGVPTGADSVYIYSYGTSSPYWQAGDTYDIDNILIEKSNTLGDYFDGSTPNTTSTINAWTGIGGSSSSTQRVLLPVIKSYIPRTATTPIGSGELGGANVMDYGAKRDNQTDDLDAFVAAQNAAIAAGHCKVYAPGGLGAYRLRSAFFIKSYVTLYGDGMDVTTLRLLDSAPLDTFVITNSDYANGNTYVRVQDMTLDWNVARTGNPLYSGEGGARSSCITYANVTQGWITRVKSINAGLHGIDITSGSLDYNYPGDMAFDNTPNPSRYIYIDGCVQTAWGDDGLTTHHSEYLYINDNYAYDARCRGNNNGIEIDDGSRHVFISNSRSMHCYGGLEIKAHVSSPTAQDVHVNGYVSIGDVRSYNWRHIGHHASTDPVSLSAFDITAVNLVSISPNNSRGFQEDADPRALCISAFRNVSVTNFTAIGNISVDGAVPDYTGQNTVVMQFMCGNVTLNNFNIRGFKNATNDVYFTGGSGPVWNCSIDNLNVYKSATRAIGSGTGVLGIGVGRVHAVAPDDGTADIGIGLVSYQNHKFSSDITLTGYPVLFRADGNNFTSIESFLNQTLIVPAGTTSMRTLTAGDYYLSSTLFPTMGTDRPSGAVGGYFLSNSKGNSDTIIQTLTRNTTTTSQARYWRVLNFAAATVGNWQLDTVTDTPYSAT